MEKIAQVSNALCKMGVVRYFKIHIPRAAHIRGENEPTEKFHDTWILESTLLGKKLSYLIQIEDWNFTKLPKIYLALPFDASFSNLLRSAHFDPIYSLIENKKYIGVCYSLDDACELPRSFPAKVVEWALKQTGMIIRRTISESTYRKSEILREIEPIWILLSLANARLSITPGRHQSCVQLLVDSIPSKNLEVNNCSWFIPTEADAKIFVWPTCALKTRSGELAAIFSLFESIEKERKSINVLEFMRFLRSVDKQLVVSLRLCVDRLWKILLEGKEVRFVLVVQETFFLPFSLSANGVHPSCKNNAILKELDGKTPPNLTKRIFMHPHRPLNLTPQYIYRRNIEDLASKDLSGLNIALIGCGAIGGHLSLALARLGAGAMGGNLALIDHDELGTQNLGRHVLGKKYLERKKSLSLLLEIGDQLSGLNVTSFDQSAVSYSDEFYQKYQIIVDATGKVELSEALNERYQAGGMPTASLLHIWIRGNGEAVQGIWVDLTPEFRTMNLMRFPVNLPLLRRSQNEEEAFFRRTNHQSHQRA